MKLPLLLLFFAATGLGPEQQAALNAISPADLRANLSFLSSDLLEGRDTPSRGLEIAGEFIASRFRRAGLEPAASGSYFQTADYVQLQSVPDGVEMTITDGKKSVHADHDLDLQNLAAIDLNDVPIYKVDSEKIPDLNGKVAVLKVPDYRAQGARERMAQYSKELAEAQAHHPLAIVLLPEGASRRPAPATRLVLAASLGETRAPSVVIRDEESEKFLEDAEGSVKISIHAKAPVRHPVQLRNVAGLLKGSDPQLAGTYILVTAHYDHIGVKTSGEGDRIYNGANDDGSGTVSVMEIAQALASVRPQLKRSILFMCFFGEEKGLFGSRYYAAHPLFPLAQTIAQINLEQLGRTDDSDGRQVASATFTGFDFSDLPSVFAEAGKATGVRVYKNEKSSDPFFARSDNQSLADAGIPAHTLGVAFEFPDYHGVGDEWQKIDYDNMAKVDRMIALGLIDLAERSTAPKWNESNPKTEKYVGAFHKLHP